MVGVAHADDWRRLGTAVRRRREEELNLTQGQIQERGGPSPAKLRIIEKNGEPGSIGQRRTIAALEKKALEWPEGEIDRILNGNLADDIEDPDLAIVARRLQSIADNPRRSNSLRTMARASLDTIAAILSADIAEGEAGQRSAG